MLTKKSLLIAGAVTTIGVAGAIGTNAAFATYNTNNDDLVAKIAAEFNLSEDEVQAVFDDYKSDKEDAKVSAYLQGLVDKGKITAEQKTLIEMKLGEVRDEMKQMHDELETWAEEQGIDVEYVMMDQRHGGSDYLEELVEEGKITAEQKTAIEQKREELKDKRDTARDELKQWAEDNNINVKYLMMNKGYYRGGDDHKHHHDYDHHK